MWCGLCFLVSVVGFWWPMFMANFGPDATESRLGMVILFTGPFVLAAGIRSVFACRRLFFLSRGADRETAGLRLSLAFGVLFTIGATLPAVWVLFVFTFSILISM